MQKWSTKRSNLVKESRTGAGYGNGKVQKTTTKVLKKKLISCHSLTNFEIQKLYQNEPRFNGIYSRHNLTKIKYNTIYIIIYSMYNIYIYIYHNIYNNIQYILIYNI